MASLAEIRQKYPQYNDMTDMEFATKFHNKYYSDIPFNQFAAKIGLNQQQEQQAPQERLFNIPTPVGPIPIQPSDIGKYAKQAEIGMGRGFTETGQAVKYLGKLISGSPDTQDYLNKIISEKQAYEQTPIGKSPVAKAEAFGAQIAPFLALRMPPGLQGARGAAGFIGRTGFGGLAGAAATAEQIPTSPESAMGALERVGKGAAVGGALSVPFEVGRGILNLVKSPFIRAANSPQAVAAKSLGEKTGQDFSIGQASGNAFVSKIEAGALQGDAAIKFHNKQLLQSVKNLIGIAKNISPGKPTPASVGNKFKNAFTDVVNRAVKYRQLVANRDYGAAEKAIGDGRIVSVNNFKDALTNLASESVPGGEAVSRGAAQALRSLDKMAPDGMIKFSQFRNWQSRYSAATSGKATIFKDISSADSKYHARQLLDALNKDIESTANSLGDGKAATLLRKANANYTKNSQTIDKLGDSVLGQLFGKNEKFVPEKAAEKLMKMKPSEIDVAKNILTRREGVDAMNELRSHVIRNAMKEANISESALASQLKYSPEQIIRNLTKEGNFKSIFEGTSRKQLHNELSALGRIADLAKAGTGGAQAIQSQVAEVGRIGGGLATGSEQSGLFLAGFMGKIFSAPVLRKMLFTPEGKAILSRFSKSRPSKADIAALTQYINTQMSDNNGN